jgi:hypothetical protein
MPFALLDLRISLLALIGKRITIACAHIGPLIGAISLSSRSTAISILQSIAVDLLVLIDTLCAVHTAPMLRAAPGLGPGPVAEEGGEESPRSR